MNSNQIVANQPSESQSHGCATSGFRSSCVHVQGLPASGVLEAALTVFSLPRRRRPGSETPACAGLQEGGRPAQPRPVHPLSSGSLWANRTMCGGEVTVKHEPPLQPASL